MAQRYSVPGDDEDIHLVGKYDFGASRESLVSTSRSRWRMAGWQFSVLGWTAAVVTVLTTNLALAIFVGVRYGFSEGLGVVMDGDCSTIGSYNTGVHLVINALSTILLCGSNYCMQCLTAPTRAEIDQAHRRGITLEVGIASVHNLHYVASWKRWLWMLLVLSSLPLHLLYNSVVYSALASNGYYAYGVNDAVLNATTVNATALLAAYGEPDQYNDADSDIFTPFNEVYAQFKAGTLTRLEPAECITAYGKLYLSKQRNVFVVSPNDQDKAQVYGMKGADATSLDQQHKCPPDPVSWMCPSLEDTCVTCISQIQSLVDNAGSWSPFGQPVAYCLSQTVNERCELRFSLYLAITVILCNLIKASVMLYMTLHRTAPRLHTIGDAVRSFLSNTDTTTAGQCLLSAADCPNRRFNSAPADKQWKRERTSFYKVTGLSRWALSLFFYVAAIIVSIFLLIYGITQSSGHPSASQLFSVSLGSVSALTTIYWNVPSDGASGFLANVLLSNLPQLILSCAYFTYNALFTSMLAAYEWSQMILCKGLRVSHSRKGHQRSTYFLQLPYRYAVPLACASAVMHWLVSQSFFLIAVTRYNPQGYLEINAATTHYTCGWSPTAILCVVFGGLLMIAAGVGIGVGFHLKPGLPLGGTYSAVISAACHPSITEVTSGERPLEQRKLQWGVIRHSIASKSVNGQLQERHISDFAGSRTSLDSPPSIALQNHPVLAPSFPTEYVMATAHLYNNIPMGPDNSILQSSPPYDGSNDTTEHCSFSSQSPEFPIEDTWYR